MKRHDIGGTMLVAVYKQMKLGCYDRRDPTSKTALPTDTLHCEAYFTCINYLQLKG